MKQAKEIQQKRKEITDLIDSIKSHSDLLSENKDVPLLELGVILAKITKLHEKALILKYLYKKKQNNSEADDSDWLEKTLVSAGSLEGKTLLEESKQENKEEAELGLRESIESGTTDEKAEPNVSDEVKDADAEEDPLEAETLLAESERKRQEEVESKLKVVEEEKKERKEEDIEEKHLSKTEAISMDEIEKEEKVVGTQDVNESLSAEEDPSLSEQLKKQPIADLLTAIGLNERYLYANELFGGDIEEFRNVVRLLNEFEDGSKALAYFDNELRRTYGWEEDNTLATALYLLVQRRFQ